MFGDQRRGQIARNLLAVRAIRTASFPPEIFDEHAWNMMLHLFSALVDNQTVSQEVLFSRAKVEPSYGNRWLQYLMANDQVDQREDGDDVALSVDGIARMRSFLDIADEIHSGRVGWIY